MYSPLSLKPCLRVPCALTNFQFAPIPPPIVTPGTAVAIGTSAFRDNSNTCSSTSKGIFLSTGREEVSQNSRLTTVSEVKENGRAANDIGAYHPAFQKRFKACFKNSTGWKAFHGADAREEKNEKGSSTAFEFPFPFESYVGQTLSINYLEKVAINYRMVTRNPTSTLGDKPNSLTLPAEYFSTLVAAVTCTG